MLHLQHGIHNGYVRGRGRAPDALEWELGRCDCFWIESLLCSDVG